LNIGTAFITGTGFYSLPGMESQDGQDVSTPYGIARVEYASLKGLQIAFVARHGKRHDLTPNQINYRANIYALKEIGAKRILATSVCGSLEKRWGPGTLILIDQFINFAHGRQDTFYPLDGKIFHVDVTDPYCLTIQDGLSKSGSKLGIELQRGATYACWNGPRFETRAEIEMTRRSGGQLVGQTNYPECVLAREMAICYATVAIVSNYAAGMQDQVTVTEVKENLKIVGDNIAVLFGEFLQAYPDPVDCACQHALDEAAI
jgi:5'-methylthioadenosine phosphorylase